jgi:hypothetical protein
MIGTHFSFCLAADDSTFNSDSKHSPQTVKRAFDTLKRSPNAPSSTPLMPSLPLKHALDTINQHPQTWPQHGTHVDNSRAEQPHLHPHRLQTGTASTSAASCHICKRGHALSSSPSNFHTCNTLPSARLKHLGPNVSPAWISPCHHLKPSNDTSESVSWMDMYSGTT